MVTRAQWTARWRATTLVFPAPSWEQRPSDGLKSATRERFHRGSCPSPSRAPPGVQPHHKARRHPCTSVPCGDSGRTPGAPRFRREPLASLSTREQGLTPVGAMNSPTAQGSGTQGRAPSEHTSLSSRQTSFLSFVQSPLPPAGGLHKD